MNEHEQLVECAKAIKLEVECTTSLCQLLIRIKDACDEKVDHNEIKKRIDEYFGEYDKVYKKPMVDFLENKVCIYSILHPDLSKSE